MIYITLKSRVSFAPDAPLLLRDVADVLCDAALKVGDMPLKLPGEKGIWQVDALPLVRQIHLCFPEEPVTVLGTGVGYLHRVAPPKKNAGYALRAALVFLLLLAGSALAIAWFHSDVDMHGAQQALYQLVTGHEAARPILIALPYALGVGIGVLLFYALIGRKTVSPLDVKLNDYRSEVEENAGRRCDPS